MAATAHAAAPSDAEPLHTQALLEHGLQQLNSLAMPPDATPELQRLVRTAFMSGAWLCNQLHLQTCRMATGPSMGLLSRLQLELAAFGLEADVAAMVAETEGGV